MKRKEFLKLGAIAATLGPLDSILSGGLGKINLLTFLENSERDITQVSARVQQEFIALIQWLSKNGWDKYLNDAIGINLALTGEALQTELLKDLDKNKLKALTDNPESGFDDFAGMNLIKPGFPAFSLLYHAMASPRVRSAGILAYPDIEQIDALENYIYALAAWEHLKNIYEVTSNNDLVMAVFAYEYRPAFKTPHHQHADLVFSRTGVARVGQHDMNYDRINRCFTNQPGEGLPVQDSAVVPARYGLFIAKHVKSDEINLMTTGIFKPGDKFDDREDHQRTFLQPIRKVFQHDLLFGESKLNFTEMHRSEKLAKLTEHTDLKFYKNIKPTVRTSSDLIVQDKNATNVNSSFLVISKPQPLIRIAKEGNQPMYFLVPAMIPGEDGYSRNRYFTSYNTQEVQDVELLVRTSGRDYQHIPNQYNEPRTQPLFLNITHELDSLDSDGYREVMKDSAFEKRLNDGMFQSPLFEDSICEGTVNAQIIFDNVAALKGLYPDCLPAFSIVTAPDFFPQVDNFDLMTYDVAPGTSVGVSNFYEGGLASLATCRLTPNPEWIPPHNLSDHQTYTAVLSKKSDTMTSAAQNGRFKNPTLPKGYIVSGFLPDVASSVFAPGWDITYSADKPGSTDVYLSTEGLGSPFVEDMKLCAAANGMWPASSPDAARTYQGSLDPWSRNPTAIPLLDDEIGMHKNSPAGLSMKKETFGWDGVQGPFLERINGKWKVNFADMGRADVVQHALDGNIDMSKLRTLTSAELISRMACLKKCIENLPKVNFKGYKGADKMVAFTRWWLISAEPVDFGKENARGWGIPKNLVGTDTNWVTDKSNAKVSGKGYLYVIIDINDKSVTWDGFGRRRADCTKMYVCQVTDQPTGSPQLAIATIKSGKAGWKIIT